MRNNDRNYYIPDIALTALLFYGISAWVYRQKWDTAFIAVASLLGASAPLLVYYYQQRFQKKQIAEQKVKDLRDELREYFLTNCKPFITEILKDKINKFKIYVERVDENNKQLYDIDISNYYFEHHTKILDLCYSIGHLTSHCFHIRHEKYWLRFSRYGALLDYCGELYRCHLTTYLAYLVQIPPHSKEKMMKACNILVCIDILFSQLEFVLFMNEFDDDVERFLIEINQLNQKISESNLFGNKELFDFSKNEKKIKNYWEENILTLNQS